MHNLGGGRLTIGNWLHMAQQTCVYLRSKCLDFLLHFVCTNAAAATTTTTTTTTTLLFTICCVSLCAT